MSLQMSQKELQYQRLQFYETMKNHGIPCRIYSIHDTHDEAYDFYNDIIDKNSSYDDFIDTSITYEEHPSIKTLKSLGWYVDSEESPAIGYIPVSYKDSQGNYAEFLPNLDDRISLVSNPYDSNASTRDFLLKDFKGNGFPSVIYYTVKLAPFRCEKQKEVLL